MKQLVYRLTNGAVVKTLKEAMASGQGYKTEYVAVVEPSVMTNKREEMLKKNGYIAPPSRLVK